MPLKVVVDDVFDKPLNLRTGEGITELVIEISYDGTVWNFEYDYELAYLAMSGKEADARFEFVEAFMEDGFRGILETNMFKGRFCKALLDQGLKAFVGDAEIPRVDEMALLVAMLWYINRNYRYTEPGGWIVKRIGEIKDPKHDSASVTWSIDSISTDEPRTNTVKIQYELEINGWAVGSFDRYAHKHAYDPIEINIAFEIDDYDDMPSHVNELLDIFNVEIPDAVTPEDIEDPVTLVTSDDGEYFVIYNYYDDDVSIEEAIRVRRFATSRRATEAIEAFEYMAGDLDDMREMAEHKVTLAMLVTTPEPGTEVKTSDLNLIKTYFYKKREGYHYSGDWTSISYKNNKQVDDDE